MKIGFNWLRVSEFENIDGQWMDRQMTTARVICILLAHLKNEFPHSVFLFTCKKVTDLLNSEMDSGKSMDKAEIIQRKFTTVKIQ